MIHLSDQEFTQLVDYIRGDFGINLSKKRLLIEARMFSVLTEKKLSSFTEYFELLKKGGTEELNTLLNKLTTNHTYFMREPAHFEFMKQRFLPEMEKSNPEKVLRIWSAGCSTGEEAYTAIMVMKDYFGAGSSWDYRILATDISTQVLDNAQIGIYSQESLRNIPDTWERRYFKKVEEQTFQLAEEIRKEVIFRRFNLMDPFPFQKKFDLIFCRNVMIYFDQQTKNELISKFYQMLRPGGYLFIGHSETVQRETVAFKYVEPSIYQKG
jgi:chemotaxis protein methyltransferase CheR